MTSSEVTSRNILNRWLAGNIPVHVRLEVGPPSPSVVLDADCLLQACDVDGIDFGSRPYWGVTLMLEPGALFSAPQPANRPPGGLAVVIVSGSLRCVISGEIPA